MRRIPSLFSVVFALLVVPVGALVPAGAHAQVEDQDRPTAAQDRQAEDRADQVLAEALDRYHTSLQGIRSIEMEIVQMGMPTHMRMEVVEEPGAPPRVQPVSVTVMGMEIDPGQADFPGGAGIFETPLEDLRGVYRYEGEVELQGRMAHHLSFVDPDPSGMAGEMMGEAAVEFLDGEGALYLDVETFDLLRMEWVGEVLHEGEREPLSMIMVSEDYREESGYRYPAVTRVETDAARFSMTDEEREMLRAQLDQLAGTVPEGELPEGEMGEMMAGLLAQVDQFTRMLEEGVMEIELEMRDVRVER